LWMTRIMITWGLCTILVGISSTAHQFYATRFLLGAAEGGFFPGIVVYLNEWFPSKYKATALARYVMASPIALALGGPLAGRSKRGAGLPPAASGKLPETQRKRASASYSLRSSGDQRHTACNSWHGFVISYVKVTANYTYSGSTSACLRHIERNSAYKKARRQSTFL